MGFRLGLCLLLLAPLIASGLKLTANEGAGPLYRGRDLPYYLAPLPGQNVSSEGGTVARGYLEVPNRSGSTGGVCARVADNPPLTALVVCRSLGWRGAARAAALAPPANSTAVGNGGTAWSSLACNGTEAGLLACRYSRVEANFTGCSPRVRLVIECYSDPGRQGELRFSPAPPAASTVGEQYSQALTVEVFQDGFWGYPAGPFSPRVAVVLCREAGYTNGTAGVGDTTLAGLGYRPAGNAPKLTSLRCNGTEAALDECRFSYAPPLPFSPYFEYVPRERSISYYQGPFLPLLFCPDAFNSTEPAGEDGGAVEQQEYAVRLHSDADTATPADGCVSGRVQMSVGGFWGLVAMGDYGSGAAAVADEVAQANAEVICRQLGAGDTGNITTSFDVADADVRLPVWLSDLECGGDEASVLDCGYTSDVVPGGSLRTAPEADYALSVSCCRA